MDNPHIKKIDKFFKAHKYQLFKKGEILIRSDDDPAGIFYLTSGIVKQYIISKKGEELVINIFKPSAFFPMSWAITDIKNSYFYEAVTEVEVYRAPKNEVLDFIKNNPDILLDLLNRIYSGLDGLYLRMIYLMSGNTYGKLINELIIHAKRFGQKDKNGVTYKVGMSEKDIASQSGLARETISRELKLLKEKRIVTFKKNMLVIKDMRKLESELSEY